MLHTLNTSAFPEIKVFSKITMVLLSKARHLNGCSTLIYNPCSNSKMST